MWVQGGASSLWRFWWVFLKEQGGLSSQEVASWMGGFLQLRAKPHTGSPAAAPAFHQLFPSSRYKLPVFPSSHPSYLLSHPHPFALILHFTIWHSSYTNDSLCEAIFLAWETSKNVIFFFKEYKPFRENEWRHSSSPWVKVSEIKLPLELGLEGWGGVCEAQKWQRGIPRRKHLHKSMGNSRNCCLCYGA